MWLQHVAHGGRTSWTSLARCVSSVALPKPSIYTGLVIYYLAFTLTMMSHQPWRLFEPCACHAGVDFGVVGIFPLMFSPHFCWLFGHFIGQNFRYSPRMLSVEMFTHCLVISGVDMNLPKTISYTHAVTGWKPILTPCQPSPAALITSSSTTPASNVASSWPKKNSQFGNKKTHKIGDTIPWVLDVTLGIGNWYNSNPNPLLWAFAKSDHVRGGKSGKDPIAYWRHPHGPADFPASETLVSQGALSRCSWWSWPRLWLVAWHCPRRTWRSPRHDD